MALIIIIVNDIYANNKDNDDYNKINNNDKRDIGTCLISLKKVIKITKIILIPVCFNKKKKKLIKTIAKIQLRPV